MTKARPIDPTAAKGRDSRVIGVRHLEASSTRANPAAGKTTARLQTPAEGFEAVIPYLMEINRITADLVRENETFAALMSARGDRISRLNQQNQDNVDRIMGIGPEA